MYSWMYLIGYPNYVTEAHPMCEILEQTETDRATWKSGQQ